MIREHRQAVGGVLLAAVPAAWIAAVVLFASPRTAWSTSVAVILFLGGGISLLAGLQVIGVIRRRPKPLDPEIARMLAHSGPFFDEPKAVPPLRKRRRGV